MTTRPRASTATPDVQPVVGKFSIADNASFVSDEKSGVGPTIPLNFDDETPPAANVKRTPGKLEKNLQDTYATIGTMVGMFDPYCGRSVVDNSEAMAQSMAEWAAEDPKVRKALEKMLTVGAFGKVIAAHMPVVMAISMHHVPAVRARFVPQEESAPVDPTATDDYGNPVTSVA
jgi:hypothetical protein